jgi:hypothetical protein
VTLATWLPLSAKLALTSKTSGGRSAGIVRMWIQATVFLCVTNHGIWNQQIQDCLRCGSNYTFQHTVLQSQKEASRILGSHSSCYEIYSVLRPLVRRKSTAEQAEHFSSIFKAVNPSLLLHQIGFVPCLSSTMYMQAKSCFQTCADVHPTTRRYIQKGRSSRRKLI